MKISKLKISKTSSFVRSLVPSKAAAGILGCWLIFSAALAASAPAANPPITNSQEPPAGLSASEWKSIRAAHHEAQLAIGASGQGNEARNPTQQWRTRFDDRGFLATPEAGGWSWGLELQSYGFAGQERPVKPDAHRKVKGALITYDRGAGLNEWLINQSRGLEHGFTIAERPAGSDTVGAPLRIVLQARGSLRPVVSRNQVAFVAPGGATVVRYHQLAVFDAIGRQLPAHFTPNEDGFALSIDERNAQYPLTIDPIAQQAYLKASNTNANDDFGRSVAISGDTVIVGAEGESSAATGVNGNQSDNSAAISGAAYVFVRNAGSWSQQAYLKASNTNSGDNFGYSVAISGDTAVVGAFGERSAATGVNGDQSDNTLDRAGAAYIFVRTGNTWTQQAYLKASNPDSLDYFGVTVAVSGDTALIGALGEKSTATGIDGDQTNNGAENAGAAYIFVRTGSTWAQQAYVKASNTGVGDQFGHSVAISNDTAIVGAQGEASAATGIDGDQTDNSAAVAGAAYVFVRSGSTWTQQAYLKASNTEELDFFAYSVAISGDTAVAGAVGEASAATGVNGDQTDNSINFAGAAYVFVRTGSSWTQQAYLKASNPATTDSLGDRFGESVAISGDQVIIGATQEDSAATGINGDASDNGASDSGAAYIFSRKGSTWSQEAYVKASNTNPFDTFGIAVAISDDTAIAGALFEDSSATGVNGDQSDNTLGKAGAAYVYDLNAAASAASIFLNISTRMDVLTGEKVLIGGFIVTGGDAKKILLRAIGPSLGDGALADPVLELHGADGSIITTNDNWMSTQKDEIEATGIAPTNNLESAIVATLDPGSYTAVVSGKNGGAGVGLVEAYDLNSDADSQLANISTRGQVETDDNVMIGGFILGGGASDSTVLVRALGPSLPLDGKLADPTLALYDAQGTLIDSNDNWMDSPQKTEIEGTTIPPADPMEAALFDTLASGAYTAVVTGVGGSTGVGLVEVYRL